MSIPKYNDKNWIGQKFNMLTIIESVYIGGKKGYYWKCRCDCGNEKIIEPRHILDKTTVSCGCKRNKGRPKMELSDEEKKSLKRKYNKECKDYKKSRNICVKCGKVDAYTLNGKSKCADCVQRDTELHREKRDAEKNKELQKKIREQRKNENKCSRCGKKLKDGYTYSTCELCRLEMREKRKIRYSKQTGCNLPRGDNGMCWQCNKAPCIDGGHLCQSCYDEKLKYLEKANEANRKEKEFIWTIAAMWAMEAGYGEEIHKH